MLLCYGTGVREHFNDDGAHLKDELRVYPEVPYSAVGLGDGGRRVALETGDGEVLPRVANGHAAVAVTKIAFHIERIVGRARLANREKTKGEGGGRR